MNGQGLGAGVALRLGLCWLAAALAQPLLAAEVWKCKLGELTQYSDRPCPAQGEPLATRALQANLVDPSVASRAAGPLGGMGNVGNVCPDDAEIGAMELRASSSALGLPEKAFFREEIGRARQCRLGQGRYTAADWALSRQAQAAQGRQAGGAEARQKVQARHQAADAAEAARLARLNAQNAASAPAR